MTDFEKFIEFYAQFDITPEIVSEDDGTVSLILRDYGFGPKIDGYSGFFTRIEFGIDGSFVRQGFWE